MGRAFRCPLCRQTFFSGRGHVYSRKHRRQLQLALARLMPQVDAARKALGAARVERSAGGPEAAAGAGAPRVRWWCPCCQRPVPTERQVGALTLPHAGLLQHLASPEHKKATNKFWWENKAEAQLKEKFIVSPQDYARFKKSLAKALDSFEEKEDRVIKEMAAEIRQVDQSRQELVRSVLESQAAPDPGEGCSALCNRPGTCDREGVQESTAWQPPARLSPPQLDWMEEAQPLTFIGHQDVPGRGNIHTGATPPWLQAEEPEAPPPAQEIGPSYEEFLKEKEKQKVRQLPPERVGANFDHSSSTDAGWLPSFGRVWNNGRRWQSRHQFRAETGARGARARKAKN
ncbi:centrosomal AT-AC splicing factor [Tachyglossus aculeatus]|uniref:centrosomal AT-AC splicing factor n=1 Tax=Tachyglossus aculeatus TaxID=9261 RepID=UPI0018F53948|nr:centrosomal AT-AC splicing factor [Tachyglossus aculeatus]